MGKDCAPEDEQQDKVKKITDAFVKDLRKIARDFAWKQHPERGLIGKHPKVEGDFCPVTAVYWKKTGEFCPRNKVHDIAAEELGIGDASTHLVEAIDDRPNGKLGKKIREAVGVLEVVTS